MTASEPQHTPHVRPFYVSDKKSYFIRKCCVCVGGGEFESERESVGVCKCVHERDTIHDP